MESITREYFLELFTSSRVENMEYILSGVQSCILESMNHLLLATYAEGEILEALKGMGPTKASGADGFPAIFYQKYWHIVGKDTCNFCLDILNNVVLWKISIGRIWC